MTNVAHTALSDAPLPKWQDLKSGDLTAPMTDAATSATSAAAAIAIGRCLEPFGAAMRPNAVDTTESVTV